MDTLGNSGKGAVRPVLRGLPDRLHGVFVPHEFCKRESQALGHFSWLASERPLPFFMMSSVSG